MEKCTSQTSPLSNSSSSIYPPLIVDIAIPEKQKEPFLSESIMIKNDECMRNKVNDLPRPGAPRTTTTNRYIRAAKEAIQLKANASVRNVNAKLQQQGFKTSKSSKGGKLYKWNNILNTDFSGTFTLTPHYNQHNEGVYAKSSDDILYNLKVKPKEKFQKSVMLWGGISYQGLFPKESPIFLDEWLESIRSKGDDHHKKMYFTGERYAKFIRTIVAEKAAEEFSDLRNVIFQDDQDRKQRMQDPNQLSPLTPEVISRQATINIGIIGHVAHGKSTVVKCLSGAATGRFKSEKDRNMTIKLGYANAKIFECDNDKCPRPRRFRSAGPSKEDVFPCDRPRCGGQFRLVRHVSFVDCPGQNFLMATMLNGTAVMDAALLLIAANDTCPQPQTSEHLAAISIMNLNSILVLQNKIDLVKEVQAKEQYQQIIDFLKGTNAEGAPIIQISAILKYNIEVICEYIIRKIPVPLRDFTSKPRLIGTK
ncbi:unnamed protein product [Rotaria sordida]|uniref:Tr-type G domain-containing protein n=1 Tax=Rotaria sordida TaxID=392033 RepID=A0A819DEA9_9BILA|nr:unnamed protein product [Rotaria sordida]